MGPVAEDRMSGVFASAEIGRACLRCLKSDGCVIGDFMAAIAEWLVGAEAAGAPEIAFPGFQLDGIGAFLSNFRFRHGEISSAVDIGIIAETRPAEHG